MRWPRAAGATESPRDARSPGLRRICATVLLITPLLAGCAAEPVADADLVRCLAPQNRARLVDAAVALDLAQRTADPTQVVVGARPLSLEQWRDEPDSEFPRACTAYGAASGAGAGGDGGGSGGPWLTSVVTLLAALVGAVGAGMVTAHLNHRGRRYQYATDLRRAATALERVGAGYVRGKQKEAKPLAGQAVLDGRDELDETIRQIVDRHPSWLGLSRLRARLRESPLDEGLDQWLLPQSDRPQRLRELEERLAEVVGDALRLARAIESPVLLWVPLHRKPRPVRVRTEGTEQLLPTGGVNR